MVLPIISESHIQSKLSKAVAAATVVRAKKELRKKETRFHYQTTMAINWH